MGSSAMKRLIAVSLLVGMAACSTSQPTEESVQAEATPSVADAGTDAVPQADASAQPDAMPSTPPSPDASVAIPPVEPTPAAAPTEQAAIPAAPSAAMPSGNSSYAVQDGDTLMKVAFENYGDVYKWKQLYELNKDKISNPNSLVKGTVLKLDPSLQSVPVERNGEKYLIKVGDTLGKISMSLYGTMARWKELWENNKQLIHNPNLIFAGFNLYYHPGSTTTLSQETSAPAAVPAPTSQSGIADAPALPPSFAAARSVGTAPPLGTMPTTPEPK